LTLKDAAPAVRLGPAVMLAADGRLRHTSSVVLWMNTSLYHKSSRLLLAVRKCETCSRFRGVRLVVSASVKGMLQTATFCQRRDVYIIYVYIILPIYLLTYLLTYNRSVCVCAQMSTSQRQLWSKIEAKFRNFSTL